METLCFCMPLKLLRFNIFIIRMVRNYKKKRDHPGYTTESLAEAKSVVIDRGEPLRKTAKKYNIPKSTLQRWCKTDGGGPSHVGSGRKTTLTAEDEKYLIEAITYAGDLGWPLDSEQICDIVEQYVSTTGMNTVFKNGRPGRDWVEIFRKRHANVLTQRKPEYVTIARAKGLTVEVIDSFFEMVDQKLSELGIKDKRLQTYNCDETGLGTDPKTKKVYFRRGIKDAQQLQPTEGKSMYTVLYCGNAAGDLMSPYVVYKAKNLHSSWLTGGPEGTTYNTSHSGWMEETTFEQWLKDVFIPHVTHVAKPIVLFYDGHGSHMTYNSVKAAKDADIIIICLPPHTSGALQPLDVGVFKGAKSCWREILKNFYRETRLTAVKKEHFPTLLKKLHKYMVEHPGSLVNGFAKSGLCPLDKSRVPKEKIILAETVTSPSVTSPISSVVTPSSSMTTPVRNSSPVTPSEQMSPTASSSSKNNLALTPKSAMRKSVVRGLNPKVSGSTITALQNAKTRRKKVQRLEGEIMTEESAMNRLKEAEEEKRSKKTKPKKPKVKKEKQNQKKTTPTHFIDPPVVVEEANGVQQDPEPQEVTRIVNKVYKGYKNYDCDVITTGAQVGDNSPYQCDRSGIRCGDFVLAKFEGPRVDYRYVCTILTTNDEDNYVAQGLRSSDMERKNFYIKEADISMIAKKDIIGILKHPMMEQDRSGALYYVFDNEIDVLEM